jgi:hypothetical protein
MKKNRMGNAHKRKPMVYNTKDSKKRNENLKRRKHAQQQKVPALPPPVAFSVFSVHLRGQPTIIYR